MGKTLTASTLEQKHACVAAIGLFRKSFGEAIEITPELCAEHAQDFDFDWAARHLLSAPALAEYEKARAPALAEYEKARAPAFGRLYNSES